MQSQSKENSFKVAIYGGNGFVGSHIAKELTKHDICTVCVSRTGHKPLHLRDKPWSESVRWCKGDASQPDTSFLKSIDAIVVCVGSAPLPTFSQEAYDRAVFMNGISNVNAIDAAGEAGVKQLVLLSAQIPQLLRTDKFAYTKGKRLALQAAENFSKRSVDHRAVVFQPGAIFGTRHLTSGKSLPLSLMMKPLSYVMPWQFICVEQLAQRVVNELLDQDISRPQFSVLKNSVI